MDALLFGTTRRPNLYGLEEAAINHAANGDNTIIAARTGQRIRVYQLFFVVNAAVNIIFKEGSNNLTGTINMLANGSFVLDFSGYPWFTTASGSAFLINLSAAQQVSGRIYFTAT